MARPIEALSHGLLLFALTALAGPETARAHGGFWRANRILIAEDDPQRIVLQSSLRGLVSSDDGGRSWSWICAEAYGRSSTSPAAATMLLTAGGGLLIASISGGLRASDGDPCSFRQPPGLEGYAARDLTPTTGGFLVLGLPTAGEQVANVLFSSAPNAERLLPLGVPLPESLIAGSVRASAAPARLFVAGVTVDGGVTIARSDDDAASWRLGATVPIDGKVAFSAQILELEGERLYVLADELERTSGGASQDTLYVSDDAGATLRPLFSDGKPLHDFARSPDRATLLVSGEGGLYRADEASALARGAGAFTRLREGPVFGLHWGGRGLLAGLDEFGQEGTFSLGRSDDGGATFTRVMSVCDVRLRACAEDSSAGAVCSEVFSDLGVRGGGFKEDFLDSPRCVQELDAGAPESVDAATGAAPDASVASVKVDAGVVHDMEAGAGESEPLARNSDAGCTASRSLGDGARAPWLSLFLFALVRRRRARCHRPLFREERS